MDTSGFERNKGKLLIGLSTLAIAGAFLAPAIPQDPAYHHFADQSSYFGIPNFWNVASNLPFLLIGLTGILELYRGKLAVVAEFRAGYLLFFIGLALVGPGSAWYHLAPDNAGLVWDRLPMTLGFMAFFTVIIAEYIAVPAGRALLWPLVLAGLASVLYWKISEARGQGDLRWYGLVQFLPMLLIPLILLLFRPSFTGAAYPWTMLGAYGAAKLAEFLDAPLFQMFHPLSGHTLKHLLAASAAYIFLMGLRGRKPIAAPEADSGSRENSA